MLMSFVSCRDIPIVCFIICSGNFAFVSCFVRCCGCLLRGLTPVGGDKAGAAVSGVERCPVVKYMKLSTCVGGTVALTMFSPTVGICLNVLPGRKSCVRG